VTYELKPLRGTEKQIAWAEKIRAEKLELLDNQISRTMYAEAVRNVGEEKIAELLSTVDAEALKWWLKMKEPYNDLLAEREAYLRTDSAAQIIDRRDGFRTEQRRNERYRY
jgi:hypothetical protein